MNAENIHIIPEPEVVGVPVVDVATGVVGAFVVAIDQITNRKHTYIVNVDSHTLFPSASIMAWCPPPQQAAFRRTL